MKASEYLEGQEGILDKLKLIPAFQQFNRDKLKEMLRVCKIHSYEKDEIVIQEGQKENCAYFMLSGSVHVQKGQKVVASLRRIGDTFGEMGLLGNEPRSATVVAQTNMTCIVIDASQLENNTGEMDYAFQSLIYRMFAEILAHRLRETTATLVQVNNELEHYKNLQKEPA